MDAEFIEQYQEILSLGLADNRYPLEHACVQLPNGWYGIDSILTGFQKILDKYEYDEMLLPTISTALIFKRIPDSLKENIDKRVLTITHTGVHKLDDPLYLSGRPDLVVPQVEKFNARSYRDLPIRRALRYFRYIKSTYPKEVSLLTDTEYPALDAEGIFATEEEYKVESAKILADFNKFIADKLKLSVFTVHTDHSISYYVILPDATVLEVAVLRLFGKELAAALDFQVLESNNKPAPPHIFDLNVTSRLFAGVVASHSIPHKVILPMHCMRTYGTSYGVDVSSLNNLRIEFLKVEFTQERFQKLLAQGGVFALKPADGGKVAIVLESGEQIVEAAEIEAKINEIMEAREKQITQKEKELFESKFAQAVKYIAPGEAAPEGFTILGHKENEPNTIVAAKLFLPLPPQ